MSTRVMLLSILAVFLGFTTPAASDDGQEKTSPVAGLTHEEAIKLGEGMYRQGVLPSGEIMMASVQGDIPVDGTMFTCQSCHLRSGLGALEGQVISPPTNGSILFDPLPAGLIDPPEVRKKLPSLLQAADRRPAYSEKTLAAAIAYGIDPSGRELDPAMPRYELDDREMSILVYYLKHLSSKLSPGVTDTTLRLATIIAEGVSDEDRAAMLAPLETYVKGRNSKSGFFQKRARFMTAKEKDFSSRDLILDRWELKGPPESWRSQLESFYEKDPVFAIVGGIAPGDWTPIHQFCEENKIPCVLPFTDFPVISDTDWYTVYFSKGYYQEGEAAARYLTRIIKLSPDIPVVQVFRNKKEGAALAKGFRETRALLGQQPASEWALNDDEVITDSFWKEMAGKYHDAAVILWLDEKDLSTIAALADEPGMPRMIFVSAGFLKERFDTLPDSIRNIAFITYPWMLPDEGQQKRKSFEIMMKVRKDPMMNRELYAQMHFLGVVMTEAFMHMKRHYYRDFFLDAIDMMRDQTHTVAYYPVVSFGQGQRYLSKGCYVVQLTPGPSPEIVKRSNWVIH